MNPLFITRVAELLDLPSVFITDRLRGTNFYTEGTLTPTRPLGAFFVTKLIPTAHPHFPYGRLVEPDK